MKRIINKRVYNTETAKYLGWVRKTHCGGNVTDLYLYKKRNGEYFLEVDGFSRTFYRNTDFMEFENEEDEMEYENKFFFEGKGIVPLSDYDANRYLTSINN